jgi:transposase-like protein
MNLLKIVSQFKTQADCIAFLENKKWQGRATCPYCQSTNTNKLTNEGRNRHYCNGCRKSFCITVGTIFHGTHIELQKWFLLIALMMNAKKSLSACQAARDLGMRRPTVWKMMHKIRDAFKTGNKALLGGIVEMDETYIKTHDVKTKKNNEEEDDNDDNDSGFIDDYIPDFDKNGVKLKRGRGSQNNTAIVGIKQKGGDIVAKMVSNVKFNTLIDFAKKNVAIGSEVQTDEFRSYRRFNRLFTHKTVNHQREYVSSKNITTNGVEGFWSLLKRGIKGQFHHISKGYLQRYINEFVYRYNMREAKESDVFDDVLARMLYGR